MKYAADFRKIARDALTNNWGLALVAGLIASILGGVDTSSGFNFELDFTNVNADFELNLNQFNDLFNADFSEHKAVLIFLGIAIIILTIVGIALFLIGSIVRVGYAKFNLQLMDRQELSVGTLFSYMRYGKTMICANFLEGIYVFLWTLLCVIPGIIAAYNYAMVPYILAENPEMTAKEALAASKAMMEGNRWRLFCLQISFFGWSLLAAFSCGIGFLFLTPYENAAEAAFYREISDSWPMVKVVDIPA